MAIKGTFPRPNIRTNRNRGKKRTGLGQLVMYWIGQKMRNRSFAISFGKSDMLKIELIQTNIFEMELFQLDPFTNSPFGETLSISDSVKSIFLNKIVGKHTKSCLLHGHFCRFQKTNLL